MSEQIPTSKEFLDALARGIAQIEGKPEPVSDYRLAQVLKVSKETVSGIRRGKTTLGAGVMERMAQIMGVPYEWILACIQAERSAQNVAQRAAWKRAAAKLRVWILAPVLLGISMMGAPRPAAAAEVVTAPVCILRKIKHRFADKDMSHRCRRGYWSFWLLKGIFDGRSSFAAAAPCAA